MAGFSFTVVVLGLISLASAYPGYRDLIPNGNNVPSPCDPSMMWEGVGHLNRGGGGNRNPFGKDFAANNYKWDATLCRMDSDGDGQTNGQELGDPNCIWTSGPIASQTTGISHPGVCEPIGSAKCAGQPFECPPTFSCPAIDEEETFRVDVDIPETVVPAQETIYTCMNFELPHDQEYHIVATTPRIDNINVMHHIIAYECEAESTDDFINPMNTMYDCNMAPESNCVRIFGLWGFGAEGNCYNENTGFLVGGNRGFKYAAYQIHWNNPDYISTYTDKSGMSFYMTTLLRQYNAGVLMVGQGALFIPPNEQYHVETGSCAPKCTRTISEDHIYLTSTLNHMHTMGRAQITELLREGELLEDLGTDETYDYNAPRFHDHATPIKVQRGDEIKTTCVFSSVGKNRTTFQGDATSDEMCFVFLIYYPRENYDRPTCVQYYDVPECDFDDSIISGCDFAKMSTPGDPAITRHYEIVFDLCRIDMCTKECREYLRAKKREPCFHGTPDRLLRQETQRQTDPAALMNSYKYFLLMDSCNIELITEGAGLQTGSAHSDVPMVPVIILSMAVLMLS